MNYRWAIMFWKNFVYSWIIRVALSKVKFLIRSSLSLFCFQTQSFNFGDSTYFANNFVPILLELFLEFFW